MGIAQAHLPRVSRSTNQSPRDIGGSNLAVDKLEEVVVAEHSLLVHRDKKSLGEVHGRVGFGELCNVISTWAVAVHLPALRTELGGLPE